MSHKVLFSWLAMMSLAPCVAGAAGLDFMRQSALYYFTDADRKLMNEAVQSVLASEETEAQKAWTNPKNGYSGKVHVAGKFRSPEGLDCRRLKLTTHARGIDSESIYPVCRDQDGTWRLAAGKELTPKQ